LCENRNEVKQIGHTCLCDRQCFTAFDAPSFSILSEEAKKGKKKKKESDKPDSFTEKMVAHLMKNLLVRIRLDDVVHSTCLA